MEHEKRKMVSEELGIPREVTARMKETARRLNNDLSEILRTVNEGAYANNKEFKSLFGCLGIRGKPSPIKTMLIANNLGDIGVEDIEESIEFIQEFINGVLKEANMRIARDGQIGSAKMVQIGLDNLVTAGVLTEEQGVEPETMYIIEQVVCGFIQD